MKKYKWNRLSIGEAVSSGILLILTLIIGCDAWSNFQFERHYQNALHSFASKRYGKMKNPLSSALSYAPDWPYAQLLEARRLVENQKLKRAGKIYQQLEENQQSDVQAAARIGLAVVRMREYDEQKNKSLLEEAKGKLTAVTAGDHLQGEAHAELGQLYIRWYQKTQEEQHLKKARNHLRRANGATGNGLAHSSMIDLYGGQAYGLLKDKQFIKAREWYEKHHLLDPSNHNPRANAAYALARYYNRDDIPEDQKTHDKLKFWEGYARDIERKGKEQQYEGTQTGKHLIQSAYQLQQGLTLTCYQSDIQRQKCKFLFNTATSIKTGSSHAALWLARSTHLLRKAENLLQQEKMKRQTLRNLLQSANRDLRRVLKMKISKNTRAFILNNQGVIHYYRALFFDQKSLPRAREKFEESLELQPGNHRVLRNLAIAYGVNTKRTGANKKKARTFAQQYLENNKNDSEFRSWHKE